jgi:hypothetical protein
MLRALALVFSCAVGAALAERRAPFTPALLVESGARQLQSCASSSDRVCRSATTVGCCPSECTGCDRQNCTGCGGSTASLGIIVLIVAVVNLAVLLIVPLPRRVLASAPGAPPAYKWVCGPPGSVLLWRRCHGAHAAAAPFAAPEIVANPYAQLAYGASPLSPPGHYLQPPPPPGHYPPPGYYLQPPPPPPMPPPPMPPKLYA